MPLLTIGARLRAICLALPEAFEELTLQANVSLPFYG
jgi:hypothetical protein